jgi:uncharacterized protein (DUF362 family)
VIDHKSVVVERADVAAYPKVAPFSPDQLYPEYSLGRPNSERNSSYDTVRSCFRSAGLDAVNFGTARWNPLRDLIAPGETVVLKPNLIKESHPRDPDGWRYVLTNGSVIRAVADYVFKAVGAKGKVIIADAPQTDSSFSRISSVLGLEVIRDFFLSHGMNIELIDLRKEEWTSRDGVIVGRRKLPGDPYGAVAFDLGANSEFVDHRGAGKYFGADYDVGETNLRHNGLRHEYLISRAVIECDVLFNLPKLKTHKKTGITVALKNLVGINADKNWLPHHTEGSPAEGGDEHPAPGLTHRFERMAVKYVHQLSLRVPGAGPWIHRQARKVGSRTFGDTENVVRTGNWYGNDTIWRMCLDLNKLLFYGRPDGTLKPYAVQNRKRHLVLVDGIVAGEGRGPMNPDPVEAGLILFGLNPASVDTAAAHLMGFDPLRIPIVRNAFEAQRYLLAEWRANDIRLVSSRGNLNGALADIGNSAGLHFEPHFGWKGHIERRPHIREGIHA